MSEAKPKPFKISKHTVWEAYLRVKANRGAAGKVTMKAKHLFVQWKAGYVNGWTTRAV